MNFQLKSDFVTFNNNHFKFRHKHSAIMFENLYLCSLTGENLTFSDLEKAVKKVKPLFSLKRAQTGRWVNEIKECIQILLLPILFEYQSRNKTVGPWHFVLTEDLQINVETEHPSPAPIFNHPFIMDNKLEQYPTKLGQFLMQWVKSFYAYDMGLINDALIELERCYKHPITHFTKCFLNLYKARLYAIKGKYLQAENLVEAIISDKYIPKQSHLGSFARVILMRIKYQKMPACHFQSLLNKNHKPEKFPQEDMMSLTLWHNSQSLLLRRKLLKTQNSQQQKILHHQVLNHLQEAIIISLALESRSYFVDTCANYSLYLQSVIPLKFSNINEVLLWHQLVIFSSSKLSVGDYSIWSYIFYAEFYLDHKEKITLKENRPDQPNSEKYYLDILTKANSCANHQQIVIFYLSYFRFAQHNLNFNKIAEIANQIIFLLREEPNLYEELIADGYQFILEEVYRYEDIQLISKQAESI
ncbi:MAG: hypothetical protein Q4D86_10205 [Pasteurella oralis]|uniref:hypothetical protein n=1 Tax=Pasteurella oralis TaxID=1071947 RepID=UPI0026F9BF50|nr:hypothetical protein [Pasteurella oralis]